MLTALEGHQTIRANWSTPERLGAPGEFSRAFRIVAYGRHGFTES